ncbi:EpsG family protein [Wohlfahrtiimonas chitiniclastica]|uniref:EpsG family protein n=1 Tax=Wohlfahrtiimonas chitiniclastica TaxID=400946 RepID=UPI0007B69BF7|nr:EpsG family protein [Wohlfahrtiimonas chitiniclastica]KZX36398.1 hypothetical protein A6V30_08380 [Wohlfahrtiimonas chitiniclastica]MBS7834570.1 EpsG family protein [Wohlfahrtiimonas chitiniclastica]
MKKLKNYISNLPFLYIMLYVISIGLLIVVAMRPYYTDTIAYVEYFKAMPSLSWKVEYIPTPYNMELGFYIFNKIISLVTSSTEIYLGCVFIILNFLVCYLFFLIRKHILFNHGNLLLFYIFLFCSSWYFTATTNGLRQSIALFLLYIALIYMLGQQYIQGVIFILIGILFHKSILLFLPFFLIFSVSYVRRYVFVITYILFIGYILGLNETIVKFLSNLFHLNVYSDIKNYAVGANYRVGFSWDLGLYTLFWCIFPRLFIKFVGIENANILNLVKILHFLFIPYFVLGFGGYSNRYAFMGWLFIPIVQFSLVQTLILEKYPTLNKMGIYTFGYVVAATYFGYLIWSYT